MEKLFFKTENDDTALISKIIAGEKALFEVIIRRLNPGLYKLARGFGYNHQDAEDLMQETYISVYSSLKQFEGRSSLKTWASKIMVNKCIYRKAHGYYSKEIPTGENMNENTLPMQTVNPEDTSKQVMKREFSKLLEHNLSQLADIYKTVFVLREVEGFSVAETADMLGVSEVNVKVRLNRSKALLQKKMETWYTGADIYEFNLVYCDGIVNKVLAEIEKL
jgi:RNA polymerase sigma factor (sigma-70 family)